MGLSAANTSQAPSRQRRTASSGRREVEPADRSTPTSNVQQHPNGGLPDLMKPYRLAATSVGLLALAGLVASIGTGTILVSAADHLDAPTTKANHRLAITDLYAFKSAGGTTLVLNV